MIRFQLVELHELKIMPRFIRDGVTDFLQALLMQYNVYTPVVSILKKLIQKSNSKKIVDFCSGGSGPYQQLIPLLNHQLGEKIQIKLTDLHPNKKAFKEIAGLFPEQINYDLNSIDARHADLANDNIRVFFSSFHHFKPEDAQKVLSDAVQSNAAIGVFEFTENKFKRILLDLLVPVSVWLLMPKTRHFGWSRFIFTYPIPILPLILWVDSIVSNLRSYSEQQLLQLATEVGAEQYHWECGKIPSGLRFFNITYLIGYPKP